jgi:Ca2+-binding EF-hand superfamily protein
LATFVKYSASSTIHTSVEETSGAPAIRDRASYNCQQKTTSHRIFDMFAAIDTKSLNLMLFVALLPATGIGQQTPAPSPDEAPAVVDSNPGYLATVIGKLNPESRKDLAEMLAQDWKDRPEWAEMLITLMARKEMGPGNGWYKPSKRKHDWQWLASKLDTDRDGMIAKSELVVDGLYPDLLFPRLDRDNDGKLRSADFEYAGREPASPPQMLSQFLSSVLDSDSNGRITLEEMRAFLSRADLDNAGFLTTEDLFGEFGRAFSERNSAPHDMPGPDEMLSMFFRGEIGLWDAGPKLGDEAPDFTLPTHDGSQTITLSKSRGKPVILIFGSFT